MENMPPTPWKNGGGTTRELALWPSADNWVWRMSVAEVAQSGPFSRFEGVDRWFAVLEGDGVALSTNGTWHPLTANSAPFNFDGGLATNCDLLGGATRDFNLMTRRGTAQAHLARLSGNCSLTLEASEIIAIYSISEGANVRFNTATIDCMPHRLIWRLVEAPAFVEIDSDHALVIRITLTRAAKRDAASKTGEYV